MTERDEPRVYWLDLETTGLDSREDRILEVAVAEAPSLARCLELGRRYSKVLHRGGDAATRLEGAPILWQMHEASGLLAECAASTATELDAERELLAWVAPGGGHVLAGRSVHFDRGFLLQRMPALAARFSYRLLDVSAVELALRAAGMPALPKAEAHRAGPDVDESAAHLARCLGWVAAVRAQEAPEALLTVQLHPSPALPGQWVARLAERDLVSQGDGVPHALEMLAGAVRLQDELSGARP